MVLSHLFGDIVIKIDYNETVIKNQSDMENDFLQ